MPLPQFVGTTRRNAVTGEWELFYSPTLRYLKYAVSGTLSLLCLLLVTALQLLPELLQDVILQATGMNNLIYQALQARPRRDLGETLGI